MKLLDLPFIVFFEIPIDDLIENLWRRTVRIDSWAQLQALSFDHNAALSFKTKATGRKSREEERRGC